MSELAGLEDRIALAFARLDGALGALAEAPRAEVGAVGAPAADAALAAELAEERVLTAQLEARVTALHDSHDREIAALQGELGRLTTEIAALQAIAGRLRSVNLRLRQNNRALREANAAGIADPDLVNAALARELDASRVEVEALLSDLGPYIREVSHA